MEQPSVARGASARRTPVADSSDAPTSRITPWSGST